MIGKNFDSKEFIKLVLPCILLMVFISIYTSVDSFFIARFVGAEALAGVNIAIPLYSVAFSCGIMFATGGGAIIAIKLGENKEKEVNGKFTTLVIVGIVFGVLAALVCFLFQDNIIDFLGASTGIKPYAMTYGLYLILAFPFLIAKVIFESILRVEGKPDKALFITIIGGIINIVFDYIFIAKLNMGIGGAGLATLMGIVITTFIGLHHFISDSSIIKFKFEEMDLKFIGSTILNGSSEMVNEFSIALTTIVFNILTVKYIGDAGVAAITIILTINFLISSVFIGFSMGVGPLISYSYGQRNKKNIDKILSYTRRFILISSVLVFAISMVFSDLLVRIYAERGTEVYKIAIYGLRYFSFSFLFAGINIFGSAFFTAFENGKVSAMISFIKSFVIFVGFALILPSTFGMSGIWLITPLTEAINVFLVFMFLIKYKDRYGYKLSRA